MLVSADNKGSRPSQSFVIRLFVVHGRVLPILQPQRELSHLRLGQRPRPIRVQVTDLQRTVEQDLQFAAELRRVITQLRRALLLGLWDGHSGGLRRRGRHVEWGRNRASPRVLVCCFGQCPIAGVNTMQPVLPRAAR